MKEVIFMIPARLGSKRVPKKNIRVLVDKPLLQYPIDLCKKVLPSENIYVNSESEVLGQLALASGVKFHKRPEELSTDTATNQDIENLETSYEFQLGYQYPGRNPFSNYCCKFPCPVPSAVLNYE